MFHYTKEGYAAKSGFNFSFSGPLKRFWFRIFYVQYDTATYEGTSWYFRFRLFKRPFFIFDKKKWNVINSFLWDNDYFLVSTYNYEDHVNLNLPIITRKEI